MLKRPYPVLLYPRGLTPAAALSLPYSSSKPLTRALSACRMGAQKLLLTHFSARYPGMPPRRGDGESGGPLIGLAFDYSRVRLGDMWKLNMYLPPIQHAFDELGEEEPMEIDLTKLH